ncbi:MAG: UPF0164 family protein [Treponema sp.]|nr:UPF0164 family protein [Treponema sp.]
MKTTVKRTLLPLLAVCLLHAVYSLDFTAFAPGLSDAFSSLADKNAGVASFYSLLIPAGGRAEGLGTAYAGIADDTSFFDYNPAASALLKNTELSLFHNAWIADSALETLAGTIRLGHVGLGSQIKVFYVPFTEYDYLGSRVAKSYYSETVGTLNASYHFFPGYTFKGIAAGINFKTAWRAIPDYTDKLTGALISGSGRAQSALALMADVGLMMQFNVFKFYHARDPNVTVGISFINVGAAFTGFGSASGVTLDNPLPTAMTIGASWRIIKPLTFAFGFQQPFNMFNIKAYQMWTLNAGVIVHITSFVSALGGFQIKGAHPRFTLGGEFEIKRVRFTVSYTLDLTSSLNPVNRFSLSAKINFGDRGRAHIQERIDTLYNEGLEQFACGNFSEAITIWKEALALDPHFSPVKNGIKSAERQLQFDQNIHDAQLFD